MTHSRLKCASIETTGIPLGSVAAAPGSNYGQLAHQLNSKFSSNFLHRATRETPDAICKRLNRMLETSVIYVP